MNHSTIITRENDEKDVTYLHDTTDACISSNGGNCSSQAAEMPYLRQAIQPVLLPLQSPETKNRENSKKTGTQKQNKSSRSSYLQPEKMQSGWYYACFCWNYDKLTDAKDMCRHLHENGCSVQLMACDSEYGLYYTICFKKSKSLEDIRDFIKTYPSKEVYVSFNIYDGKTNIGRD